MEKTIACMTEMSYILINLRLNMSKHKIIKMYITNILPALGFILGIVLGKLFGIDTFQYILSNIIVIVLSVMVIYIVFKLMLLYYKINIIYDEFINEIFLLECEFYEYYYPNELIRHMESLIDETTKTTLYDVFTAEDIAQIKSAFKVTIVNNRDKIWETYKSNKEMNKNG